MKLKLIFITNTKALFGLRFNDYIETIKNTDLPILDRYKTGTTISKEKYIDVFEIQKLISKEKTEENKEEVERTVIKEPTQISLLEIDDELRKVDDILNL